MKKIIKMLSVLLILLLGTPAIGNTVVSADSLGSSTGSVGFYTPQNPDNPPDNPNKPVTPDQPVLPQTGEAEDSTMAYMGVLLVAVIGIFSFVIKKQDKNSKRERGLGQ